MADLLFIASHQALREADDSENEKSIHLSQTRIKHDKFCVKVRSGNRANRPLSANADWLASQSN